MRDEDFDTAEFDTLDETMFAVIALHEPGEPVLTGESDRPFLFHSRNEAQDFVEGQGEGQYRVVKVAVHITFPPTVGK